MAIATPARAATAEERQAGGEYASGDLIATKYRLESTLGEGGMGSVWLARNTTIHADVALKLVRRDMAGSEEAAQRLLNEARATAQLEHPSIVRVHDFGETERGDPFIVMELLKGESLDDLTTRNGELPPPYVVQILLPILSALTAAHTKGIVHRDIKPDNIVLVPDGSGDIVPKLVDFGIARFQHKTVEVDVNATPRHRAESVVRRLTQMGQIVGCPEYMSPEQARADQNVDGRADLWSIIVVLYETITGFFPFGGDDIEQLLLSILADEPQPLDYHGIDDPELWAIMNRGLRKNVDKRWQTARELGVALATWAVECGVDSDITGRSIRRQWLGLKSTPPPFVSGYPSRPSLPPYTSSVPPGLSQPSLSSQPSQPSQPSLAGASGAPAQAGSAAKKAVIGGGIALALAAVVAVVATQSSSPDETAPPDEPTTAVAPATAAETTAADPEPTPDPDPEPSVTAAPPTSAPPTKKTAAVRVRVSKAPPAQSAAPKAPPPEPAKGADGMPLPDDANF